MNGVEITVTDVGGTYRDVADAARTTIGLSEGDKEISDKYMYRMYKCEHSPIRLREFKIVMENCPSWVATHFVRHHVGVEKFVSTQRTDRTGEDRASKRQDEPVRLQMNCNAQAMINISRKRLCQQASKETRQLWSAVIDKLKEIDYPLYICCVADCVYRNHCAEFKSCGLAESYHFEQLVLKYRGGC